MEPEKMSVQAIQDELNALIYEEAVQKACGADYHKYCGDYGLESAALRVCMDKVGNSLSKSCVDALIQSGEVSQAGEPSCPQDPPGPGRLPAGRHGR